MSCYVLVIAIGLISFVLIDNLLNDFDHVSEAIKLGLTAIPSAALYRGLMYLIAEGKAHICLLLTCLVANQGPGYRLADINNSVVNLSSVYIGLCIEWAVIMVVWWYLEQIVPSQWGVTRHPLFFLGYNGSHKHEGAQEYTSLPLYMTLTIFLYFVLVMLNRNPIECANMKMKANLRCE